MHRLTCSLAFAVIVFAVSSLNAQLAISGKNDAPDPSFDRGQIEYSRSAAYFHNQDEKTRSEPGPSAEDFNTQSVSEQAETLLAADSLQTLNQARLSNTFTAAPFFDRGLIVGGEQVSMKIGGYVKADLITDLDAIGATDTFDTVTIATSGPSRRNVRFHARQTRLSFDARWNVNDENAQAFVETDFFGDNSGGNNELRLRHAYGRIGRFTAGQTWTTFTDASAVPQTLDFEGAVSNVNRRQALVRWEQPLSLEGVFLDFAVEDPQIIIETPPLVLGNGRTQSPDFLTRIRLNGMHGSHQCALLFRRLGFQPAFGSVLTKSAWGLNFAGSHSLQENTRGYYQITFGEGIGSYRGVPDVVAIGPTTASILPVFGWMTGIHHQWSESLTSNFTYSQLTLENLPGEPPGNLGSTNYLAANLIANPYERVFCGIEYLLGTRKDVGGDHGVAHRIQVSFGFYLP